MNEKLTTKFVQSYLTTKFGRFFVSTCYRKSSALTNEEIWYYETFGWNLDETDERKDWVADNSGAITEQDALKQHFVVCEQLIEFGEFKS